MKKSVNFMVSLLSKKNYDKV